LDAIDRIYKEYGYYSDALDSFTFKGLDGQDKIKSLVDRFRNIEELKKGFSDLSIIEDYKLQEKLNFETDLTESIQLPSSNVIKIHLTDQSWFAVRPSGTEPKLKIYFSTLGTNEIDSKDKMISLKQKVKEFASI
jgi:phosphoglucomutase